MDLAKRSYTSTQFVVYTLKCPSGHNLIYGLFEKSVEGIKYPRNEKSDGLKKAKLAFRNWT